MKTILINAGDSDTKLQELLDKIDDIKPNMDLYSVIIDEQLCDSSV